MFEHVPRAMVDVPILREVLAPMFAYWERVRDMLAADWPVPPERRALIAASVGHAIAFSTWRSLVREQGLDETHAVEAMTAMVRCLADN
jgi:hypothetical protein